MSNHLGGHWDKTHVDTGALLWLKKKFNIETMLDVGCGPGGIEEDAASLEIDWTGIDGDPELPERERLVRHDFTTGPYSPDLCDLVWCVEFVEHVEEQFIPNFMPSLASGKILVLTAAPPGTPGYHHVNCRKGAYWIRLLLNSGMEYSRGLTRQLKKSSSMERNFIRSRGMCFINTKRLPAGLNEADRQPLTSFDAFFRQR